MRRTPHQPKLGCKLCRVTVPTLELQWDGVLFTPDVSNKSGVKSFSIEEASDMIDYEVLYTRTDWRDPAIQQRLAQAERCEILVPRFIPLELIRNFPNG